MAAAQYEAGYFTLGLETLKQAKGKKKKKYMNEAIQVRFNTFQEQLDAGLPNVSALRNLRGICLFAMGQYEQAYEEFSAILQADPNNLNALAHSITTLEKLGRSSEIDALKERLHTAMESSENVGLMLLEQAHAKTYEVYENETPQRYHTAIESYTKGLELMEDLAPAKKVEWLLCSSDAYHKWLQKVYHSSDNNTLIKRSYSDAIKVLHEACRLAAGVEGNALEAGCWAKLGLILCKPPKQSKNIDRSFIDNEGLTEFFTRPEKCFEKSLELDPHNREAVCRYARYVLGQKPRPSVDQLRKMKELLDGAIRERESDMNWFVYCCRAEVLLALYEAERPADTSILRQALEDYNKVDKKNAQAEKTYQQIQLYLGN